MTVFLFASAAGAVEVNPARLELTIPSEQTTSGSFEVTNHSPNEANVQVSTGPYRYAQPHPSLPSAKDWFSFNPTEFILAPGATTQVQYFIDPPANVQDDAAGEYLAAILVDERPSQPAPEAVIARPEGPKQSLTTGTVTVVPRFAVPVYLKIQGRERVNLEVEGLQVEPTDSPKQIQVVAVLKNRGTVHVRPSGSLGLYRLETGEALASQTLGKGGPLLPSGTLSLSAAIQKPEPGRYKLIVTVEPQPEQLLQKEAIFEILEDGQLRQTW